MTMPTPDWASKVGAVGNSASLCRLVQKRLQRHRARRHGEDIGEALARLRTPVLERGEDDLTILTVPQAWIS